jgi:uncharacterized protein (TIGR04255 family)
MPTSGHYSRAPITEAIIDFQVELPEGAALSDLERCQDAAYPNKTALPVRDDGQDPGTADPAATAPRRLGGFLFAGADARQLYQARFAGFTMHRLAPYEGWGPFRDEARRLWDLYRQAARPRRVMRVAVRHVNRFDLPGACVELKDYLKTSPEVPSGLLQPLAGFLMQLIVPQPDIKGTLRLTEATAPASPDTSPVVLDIDLFRTDDLPPDEEGMWALLDDLHRRNDEVFEACLTEKSRELIR